MNVMARVKSLNGRLIPVFDTNAAPMTNAIWKPELLQLLTNLCNIPIDSEMISFRVNHGTPVDKNVVGLCVLPETRATSSKI